MSIAEDGSGNFIGVDYSPYTNGKIGQIINFGRDEFKKYVLADSLTDFFAFMLNEISNGNVRYTEDEEIVFQADKEYYHLTDFIVAMKYGT